MLQDTLLGAVSSGGATKASAGCACATRHMYTMRREIIHAQSLVLRLQSLEKRLASGCKTLEISATTNQHRLQGISESDTTEIHGRNRYNQPSQTPTVRAITARFTDIHPKGASADETNGRRHTKDAKRRPADE